MLQVRADVADGNARAKDDRRATRLAGFALVRDIDFEPSVQVNRGLCRRGAVGDRHAQAQASDRADLSERLTGGARVVGEPDGHDARFEPEETLMTVSAQPSQARNDPKI